MTSKRKRSNKTETTNKRKNQSIFRFDVILQRDWPIKQSLLHIRVFFGGKTESPCFHLFIHWLIKQVTITYRNHLSRSHENRLYCRKKASCANFDGTYDHSPRRESSFAVSYWVELFSIPKF